MTKRPDAISALGGLLQRRSGSLVVNAPSLRRTSVSGSAVRGANGDILKKLVSGKTSSGLQGFFTALQRQDRTGGDSTSGAVFRGGEEGRSGSGTRSADYGHLESSIDQLVASSLVNGRQTSSILRGIFGLAPSLIGR